MTALSAHTQENREVRVPVLPLAEAMARLAWVGEHGFSDPELVRMVCTAPEGTGVFSSSADVHPQ